MKYKTIMFLIQIVLFQAFFCFLSKNIAETYDGIIENPVIDTNNGAVSGIYLRTNSSNFYAFFGIPYAKPPIGELRFGPPRPIESWHGLYDATEEKPKCYQKGFLSDKISEDCLFLNIYTADVRKKNVPVLLWIHGGGFMGEGMKLYGTYTPHFLVQKDIIVIFIQMRLGMFGFLNLGIKEAPGNVGVMDTVLALRWVKNNIHNFGGNPNEITITGDSSGSINVHGLMLSPMSQGLFKRAILQSGTMLSYRFFNEYPERTVEKLSRSINVSAEEPQILLDHLKSLDPEEILQITSDLRNMYDLGYAEYYPFALTIDKPYSGQESFLPRHWIKIIKSNDYIHIPMMVGFMSDEGIRLETSLEHIDNVDNHLEMVVPTDLFDIDDVSEEKIALAKKIKEFYFGDKNISSDTFQNLALLCTDSWYIHPTDYLLRLQENLGYKESVFYYEFEVDGAFNNGKLRDGVLSPGVMHGDQLGFLLLTHNTVNVIPDDDFSELTRERMVTMWANYVKYGNPTPELTDILPITWETIQYPAMKFLKINRSLEMAESPYRNRMLFWQELYGYDIV